MASASRERAAGDLNAHGSAIDQLHQKLAAAPGVDKARLQTAVDKYKAAFSQFRDDALGCMN
jgi:hypothetical protein